MLEQQTSSSSTPPVLWAFTGILMAGAFDSALNLVFKLVQTVLLLIKADLYILKISVLVSAIITIGLELLLVIWIVKRRGKIREISTSWSIAAMVVWPLCYLSSLFLTVIQNPWSTTFLEIYKYADLQKFITATNLLQHLTYMGIIIGAAGYLWLQKRSGNP